MNVRRWIRFGLVGLALYLSAACGPLGPYLESLQKRGALGSQGQVRRSAGELIQPDPAAGRLTTAAEPVPTFTSTPLPTDTPTPTPLPTATLGVPITPPAPGVALSGFVHMWQTWNNCGPATLAMTLSYYGSELGQADVAPALRTNPDDKNVSPGELAAFAAQQGYQALVRVNGAADTVRTLLSNGIPVLIETWLEPGPNDGMGHYRLLTGYDDAAGHWNAYDSYVSVGLLNPDGEYQGIGLPFAETDSLWRVFNRTYVIVFTPGQTETVAAILGVDMDDRSMWQGAVEVAEADIGQRPDDAFAWFNLGSSLTALGRYDEAVAAYDRARQIGLPWRMLWYQFAPFLAYYQVGRHQDVIQMVDNTLEPQVQIEELYYWRAQSLEALGESGAAEEARQRAQELNPNYEHVVQALSFPKLAGAGG